MSSNLRQTKFEAPAGFRDAIAGLPRRQRQAVQHLVLEGSLAETAMVTGRSTGSLKTNLHRALKALRSRLGQTKRSR
jgi:RNA polymerase sigma-70 factor (ECF subfamily)